MEMTYGACSGQTQEHLELKVWTLASWPVANGLPQGCLKLQQAAHQDADVNAFIVKMGYHCTGRLPTVSASICSSKTSFLQESK